MRHYDDFEVGETDSFGSVTLTEKDIVSFAKQFDPQPFHTDPEAAAESMYGGLIASGWHTTAVTMRMLTEHFTADTTFVGGLGVDNLRWIAPVRPGDTLSVEAEVLSKEPRSEDLGLVRTELLVNTDAGDTVMRMIALMLFERRE